MSDQQGDVPVEYQDSTQASDPTGTEQAGTGHPSTDQADTPDDEPRSTGRPDAPPVAHSGREMHDHDHHDGPDKGEGSLVQLPEGATFGSEGEPSEVERERLARFASGVEREMQQDTEGRAPEQ